MVKKTRQARVYYNEIDKYTVEWLDNLMLGGLIPDGDVDTRDIRNVCPDDLREYDQCHFFAGIGVWAYALRSAGWPDDLQVWTGSCPCQPFSSAGRRKGVADERHLWPHFFHLIDANSPLVVLGEQVASNDGLAWLDLVQADMEGADYSFGAVDSCAAGFGSPQIRQRLYWAAERLADSNGARLAQRSKQEIRQRDIRNEGSTITKTSVSYGLADSETGGRIEKREDTERRHEGDEAQGESPGRDPGCADGGLADSNGGNSSTEGIQRGRQHRQQQKKCSTGGMADFDGAGCEQRLTASETPRQWDSTEPDGVDARQGHVGPTNGFWRDVDWLCCRDGRWRAVEPGTFPLAHGITARVGRVRSYGNALVAPQATEFVRAYMACRP